MTHKELAEKYHYIVRWGKMSGSMQYYIKRELERAEEDSAPTNAVYKSEDGSWHTTDDIPSDNTYALKALGIL